MDASRSQEFQYRLQIYWKNSAFLREALTHSSYTYEHPHEKHNQRLEFLGDAVLQVVISEYLFETLTDATEGELTKVRAAIVCEPALAQAARRLDLGSYMLMGRGEELSAGRNRSSVLADAVEALIGSLFVDQGFSVARQFTLNCLATEISEAMAGNCEDDYKTALQELLQKKSVEPHYYKIIDESGPDHRKIFTAQVIFREEVLGEGRGRSKKEAEQEAAQKALRVMAGNSMEQ